MPNPVTDEQRLWWRYGAEAEAATRALSNKTLNEMTSYINVLDEGVHKGLYTEEEAVRSVGAVFFPRPRWKRFLRRHW